MNSLFTEILRDLRWEIFRFRFQVLWKLRFQVWPRMEEGAHVTFKVPPPGIEFTLPSPKIGIESLPVVDPPWMPQVQTKVEEVTISQESHVSLHKLISLPRGRKSCGPRLLILVTVSEISGDGYKNT